MEVLIKPNIVSNGVYRLNIGSRYDFQRIVTFAVNDRGEVYMVYSVHDVDELVRLHDRIAERPRELKPIEAEVEVPPNVIQFLAGVKPKTVKIPAREIPADLVTKESLRDALIKHAKPHMLTWGLAMLQITPYATANILLCDEVGVIKVRGSDADYCRIGDRRFVRPPGLLWYEVPPEVWEKLSGHIDLKIERVCNGEIEEVRAELGVEAEPETLAKHVAQKVGVLGKYMGKVSEIRHIVSERKLYCGYAEHLRAYAAKPQMGPFTFGKFDAICVRRGCYAWKVGEIDEEAPDDAIIECLDYEACEPSLVDSMPESKRNRLYDALEQRLRWYLTHEWGSGVIRRFPLEVVRRVLGPVESYEEAEKKWEQILEERERRREEEARLAMQYIEERKRKAAEEVSKLLEGQPLKVSVGKYVYVRPMRRLAEEEQRKIDKLLRKYGFRYRPRWNVWILKPI